MRSALRVLIVDDESLARRGIRQQLERHPDVEIVGECLDGAGAIEAIERDAPDLVFLDVEMPEADGLEVVDAIGVDRMPATIFVTAYDHYAVRAFDARAVDYVLKPLDAERFDAALDRARGAIGAGPFDGIRHRLEEAIADAGGRGMRSRRIAVRDRGKVTFVRLDDVDWFEAADNYVRVHLGDVSHLLRGTLSRLSDRLDPDEFVRVHRSAIVRVEAITEIEMTRHGDFALILQNGTEVAGSRRFRPAVDRILAEGIG